MAFEINAPRDHHVANVTPIRPAHPSLYGRPEMFDQETAADDEVVKLTKIEAQLIATLIRSARSHLPSPRAADEAVALLMGTNRPV